MGLEYAELQCVSNFSFLRGASHPEELVLSASALSYYALGICDFNSLAGIVRAHQAAKQAGLTFLAGTRLEITCEDLLPGKETASFIFSVLVYPQNREAYGRLCRLLSVGKLRAEKGGFHLSLDDFLQYQQDLLVILIPPIFRHDTESFDHPFNSTNKALYNFSQRCSLIKESSPAPEKLSIALTKNYSHQNFKHILAVVQIAEKLNIPLVATNDVYYHSPERRPLQDVLTCIREKCTIYRAGFKLFQNSERHLKPPSEMARLFKDMPLALRRTLELSDMARPFSLDQLRYEYPDEICPHGSSPPEYLRKLTFEGALKRYPQGIPEKVTKILEEELRLVNELAYEKYFLTCYDIVRYANSIGVLCQGRGAAANSAICYCLGITAVDPSRIDLLFARFVTKERNEPPDIDIDFEHERREEVIQYIYRKYGRERAGLTCEVVTYRHRSAIREVGKALGLSLDTVDRLAKSIHRWTGARLEAQDLKDQGLDPTDSTVDNCLHLSRELLSFPRHLSQHVGGFVISQRPLCESVPILNAAMPDRTIIEWDKDDIEALGMLKIDVLGLGMLSCIRKSLEYVNQRRALSGSPALELHSIPAEDPDVYRMIQKADTVGVFQIESRAQMSMLPRLKPACFYDLVIEVAIVRPGPIQGNMVHPYLKRRNGIEKFHFPDERVADVLGKTLGVPLFQEQAMRLAIVLANFTPGEAEQLRRSMAAWKKNKSLIETFRKRIVEGMMRNGYDLAFAETCVNQIKGFSEYGFPESHAASFALLVYASAWLKCHHPAEFAAALLNSQPMGFYAPAQIVGDCKEHGVKVLPVDVNISTWFSTLEYERIGGREVAALRLGMHLIKGLREAHANLICMERATNGTYSSIQELWSRVTARSPLFRKKALTLLAGADAFDSLRLKRRDALWEIKALPASRVPMEDLLIPGKEEPATLPALTSQQEMFADYQSTGLSLKTHPVAFVRERLNAAGVSTALQLKDAARQRMENKKVKRKVAAAGLAIIRQRPGTARGVVFITLEDETGIVNLIIRPEIFEKQHNIIIMSSLLLAEGMLENSGEVVYINVEKLTSLDSELQGERFPDRSYSY